MAVPSATSPKFIYFDLGNVLICFSHERMCRQLGEVLSADPQAVWQFLFNDRQRELDYEAGRLTSQGMYQALCQEFNAHPDYPRLARAASDIFWLNVSMLPVLSHLADAGYRLGLLSNINDMHWHFVREQGYGLIPSVFEKVVLSYEVGAVKPDTKIFQYAAELAGVAPAEIFYTDDIAGHIAGAKATGFDAVQYVGTPGLVQELRQRGVKFNL